MNLRKHESETSLTAESGGNTLGQKLLFRKLLLLGK